MADGTSSDAKPKKKKGFSLTTMIVSNVTSLIVGALSSLGVMAGTDSIRTPEEREAAKKARELEAKKAG